MYSHPACLTLRIVLPRLPLIKPRGNGASVLVGATVSIHSVKSLKIGSDCRGRAYPDGILAGSGGLDTHDDDNNNNKTVNSVNTIPPYLWPITYGQPWHITRGEVTAHGTASADGLSTKSRGIELKRAGIVGISWCFCGFILALYLAKLHQSCPFIRTTSRGLPWKYGITCATLTSTETFPQLSWWNRHCTKGGRDAPGS